MSMTATEHAASLGDYISAGVKREAQIDNRGPLRFGADGRLAPDILEAFWRHGYYVFENVIGDAELAELREDMDQVLDRAPVHKGASQDKYGNPALGLEFTRNPYSFIKPLTDPWGGTDLLGGRHEVKMAQPEPGEDAPPAVPFILSGMCQIMPSASGLRLYGHPDLLAIAASINGEDFVPYNDAIFVKQAGLGGAVSWHQDGVTHWDSPDWDDGIHGFNFQVQLYACTPANCLWVLPGSHKEGKIDIKRRVAENGGSEQLPGAVPLTCAPGGVTIVNRQMLHCSFPNTSTDLRISLTFGFHRRKSVLGAKGALSQQANETYDEARIEKRSRLIPVAIDARQQKYNSEAAFAYLPFAGRMDQFPYNEQTQATIVHDYNLFDLSI